MSMLLLKLILKHQHLKFFKVIHTQKIVNLREGGIRSYEQNKIL